MDILEKIFENNDAKPQYNVIIQSGCKIPLEIFEHTQLEIGFGNGLFTVQYAKLNPQIMLYGLEISGSCVLRCARRSQGLKNIYGFYALTQDLCYGNYSLMNLSKK